MDMQLAGKTVLITGASQGIGEGLAEAFSIEGCSLILVARNGQKLQELKETLGSRFGNKITIIAKDLTHEGAVDELVETVGDIDILINNAGNIPSGDLWAVDAKQWRDGWALKVMGYIDLCRAFYDRMRKRNSGVILNNIGNGGENFDFDYIVGTTGNAALMAFTRALGGRSLQDGIRVIGVNPGPVATERFNKILRSRAADNAEDQKKLLEKLPLGRAAKVQEVADLCVFLASPRSAYTSGVIYTIDGGMTSNKSIT